MAVPYYSEGNTDRNAPSQHPISPPPPELVQLWWEEAIDLQKIPYTEHIATRAAQWGWDQRSPEIQTAADQEREAICEWLRTGPYGASIACHAEQLIFDLQYARRPKPPSLKEQALTALHAIASGANDTREQHQDLDTIRQALEALPDE